MWNSIGKGGLQLHLWDMDIDLRNDETDQVIGPSVYILNVSGIDLTTK